MPLPPTDLGSLSTTDLRMYLVSASGLPGPRANLTLLDRCAADVDLVVLRELVDDEDEYLAMCGTAGVARAVATADVGSPTYAALVAMVTAGANDDRWRVREAAARGLQLAADLYAARSTQAAITAPDSPVAPVISAWMASADPRLVRAALATICEPRLLRAPDAAAAAVEACNQATTLLAACDAATRRTEAWASLRKTLEYAWSVAVAADPAAGLPVFHRRQADPSPVVRSLVAKNLTRTRLAKLM